MKKRKNKKRSRLISTRILTPEAIDAFKARFSYDAESGDITNNETNRTLGSNKWNHNTSEYYGTGITLNGMRYSIRVHRLAWLLHYGMLPPNELDHIDRNRWNNAISNLRLADESINRQNSGARVHNSTGYKGIYPTFNKQGEVIYVAQICYRHNKIYLGRFKSPQDAARAYDRRAFDLYGSNAFTNFPKAA